MKYVFTIINMFLIAAAAYFCVDMIYKNMIPGSFMLPGMDFSESTSINSNQLQGELSSDKNKYDIIVKRNLFKVEIEEKSSDKKEIDNKEPGKLEITGLNLVLWGTVTGGTEVYAVIEDKKLRQQALYEVGDSIQEAKIKKILRHEVILTYQGKDQVLEMEVDNKNVPVTRMLSEKIDFNLLPFKEAVMDIPLDDVDALMKQARMRPHFTEGEPDGLMLFGIRPDSVFRQIGLINGDIIKDINGTAIISAEDASSLYTEIKEADNAKIIISRRGKEKELFYQFKNGQYSITTVPGENGGN
jgi:general secretion pathway protein C